MDVLLKKTEQHDQQILRNRNSRPDVFCKKGVLRNFAKFIEKHLCQSLYFNKVAGLSSTLVPFPKILKETSCLSQFKRNSRY